MSDSIRLKVSEAEESLFGKSKFLGNPDVWDDFEWPAIGDGDDAYDLTFICQINCAEIAPYDKDNKLPHTGMLYFFYDLENSADPFFDAIEEATNEAFAEFVASYNIVDWIDEYYESKTIGELLVDAFLGKI